MKPIWCVAAMVVPPGQDGARTVTSHPVTGLGVFAIRERFSGTILFVGKIVRMPPVES